MAWYAEIAVDAPLGPGRTLTYSIPPELPLAPGHVVWVPLGARLTCGVVFDLTDHTEVGGIKPVTGLLDSTAVLSPQGLALARWTSHQTASSLYQAAALMLPDEFRRRLVTLVRVTPRGRAEVLDAEWPATDRPTADRVLTFVHGRGPVAQSRVTGLPGGEEALRRLLRQGLVERDWRWQRPRAGPLYRAITHLTMPSDEALRRAEILSTSAPRQAALLLHLAELPEGEEVEAARARKEFGPGAVAGLEHRGLVSLQWRRRLRDPLEGREFAPQAPLALTRSQAEAVEAIVGAMRGTGGDRVFLLEGVTGSGKTEVYLRALAECVALGKRAIFLAPEISLTPQLVQRLASRFPGQVGVLHSGLTPGQRYDAWWRIWEGDFAVVVGARSAIFLPQPDLGLIVLDEEHEWTYKQQEPPPRYHTRDVALKLSELTGAAVVLGDATPDVVTHARALRGDITLLRLPGRLRPGPAGAVTVPLPTVETVDMREELKAGVRSIFSRALARRLADTLERGEQALLFLNRRGSAGVVQCRDCGHVLRCRRCDLSLTYHAAHERLVCHSCGARSRNPERCPSCRSRRIRYLGLGTQRVAQEVERRFGARVLRWDRDTVQDGGAHPQLPDAFSQGQAQVLVGTQMIAKGLHLPRVTLVGAMLADLGLYLPDFRAGERAFQLLCQVAGRAGREESPGRAVFQTYSPEHYAVLAAAAQDYPAFYEQELSFRRRHLYPPFSRLARLLFQHTSLAYAEEQTEELARGIRATLRRKGLEEVTVIGPAPAYPARVRGRYRWHLVLRVPHTAAVELPELMSSLALPSGWSVDVDPVTLA